MAPRQAVPHSDAQASAVDICVVGSGTKFVSGISYYTYYLSRALARRRVVSVVLMRSLIPKRFYPGRARVGAPITDLSTRTFASTFDGIDWFAVPSVPRAMRFFGAHPPKVVVFQWWSGSVLPWYLLLARAARRRGATIIIEFHEDLDTGEAAIPLLGSVIRRGLGSLIRQASGYVVHSRWDGDRLCESLGLDRERVAVIPHGPFPMGSGGGPVPAQDSRPSSDIGNADLVATTGSELTILFFGTIRPYKGLEYLIEAFDRLPRDGAVHWRLLIVGETWEGWTRPLTMVSESPYRSDIELINRYVSDDEIPAIFTRATVVVLPYLRSSASGPLHMTMAKGLPVVLTEVGGLREGAGSYSGAVFVPPMSADSLSTGIVQASSLVGLTHRDARTWDDVADLYEAFIDRLVLTDPAFAEAS